MNTPPKTFLKRQILVILSCQNECKVIQLFFTSSETKINRLCVYFTFASSTAIYSLFDSSTSTQQNALLVALSFYYYYRHYYYELYIHIILFSNHYFTSVESIPHMDPVVYLYYRPIKTKNLFFFCQMISPKLPLRITGMNIAIMH